MGFFSGPLDSPVLSRDVVITPEAFLPQGTLVGSEAFLKNDKR